MQAIRTRKHNVTNTKGERVSAQCEAGRVYMPWDYSLDTDQNHAKAAQLLVDRLNWSGVYFGGTFEHDMYWVCESGWVPNVEMTARAEDAA